MNINGHGASTSASFTPVRHLSSPCPDILNTELVLAEARIGAPIETKKEACNIHIPQTTMCSNTLKLRAKDSTA